MKKIITLALLAISLNFYGQANFEENPVNNPENGDVNPLSSVIADIDGDNKEDVITVGGNYLMWYKNIDGLGTFSKGKPIDGSGVFKKLYVADVDNDGDLDVVYTRKPGSNFLKLVKNNGDGTFAVPVLLAGNIGGATLNCQLVDIDGDTDPDIVYHDVSINTLRWQQNDGLGNFTLMSPPILTNLTNFYFTDFSGDGLDDIVITTSTGIKSYINNGNTTFSLTETLDTTTAGTFLTAADVDGDNDNDVVLLYSSGTTRKIYWYQNTTGTFANAATLVNSIPVTTPVTNNNIILLMEDVDADGNVDILCGTPHMGRLALYKNLGNAAFAPQQVITMLAKGISDITVGDIDADGQKDIAATAHDDQKIAWYKNTGTGFTDENVLTNSAISPIAAAGDMDGDSDIDLVSVSASKVAWYKNTDGAGDFSAERQIVISSTAAGPHNLQLVDVDNDGDLDIAIDTNEYSSDQAFMFFKNNGQGSFTQEIVFTGFSLDSYLLDIDTDGDLDIVTGPSGMKVRTNNGTGVFSAPEPFELGVLTSPLSVLLIDDVDTDGINDIVVANGPNSRFFKGTGGGTFAAPQNFTVATNAIFRLFDMDGDGKKDLIAARASNLNNNSSPQFIRWYRKVATSTVYEPMAFLYTGAVSNYDKYLDFEINDIDADGDPDILAASLYAPNFNWFENMGSLIFSEPQDLSSVNSVNIDVVGLADFNADGRMDIYTSSQPYNSISWLKNLGPFPNMVTGTVRIDMDTNGCTATDAGVPQVLVTNDDGTATSSVFTNPGGVFSFNAAPGNHTTSVTTVPENYAVSPQSQELVFTENNATITTADFCLVATTQVTDLEISAFLLTDIRPGFPVRYKILAKNIGTTSLTGTVIVNFDDEKLNFNTVAPAATAQTVNTLSFDLGTILPFGNKEYNITFTANTIPVVNIGDSVSLSATATVAGDIKPSNNSMTTAGIVVGSYDPNDITVREGSQILLEDADEYLHYLIRFQNTGNYYAERVEVKNSIDSKLDWSTMELETMSHTAHVEIRNGVEAIFTFDDIDLPASSVNEPGSQGYIAYKIKPKDNVQLGDVFHNQAHIYFDFNPAIDTNIATTAIVSLPEPLSGTILATNVACNGGATGAIDVTPVGGTAPYTFNWGGGVTTQDRAGLTAGDYTVVVTDANGSTTTLNITITQPASAVSGTTVVTNVTCNGGSSGAIDLTPSGGTAPYAFNWGSGIMTEDLTGVAAGAYTVIITDSNGCTGTLSITLLQPTALEATAGIQTNISCNGGANGSATVNVTGGTGAYTYSWNTIPAQTAATATGLAAGTYTVTVTDANGCTDTQTFTITEPTTLEATAGTQANVSCNGGTNGSATVNATGGTGAYTYSWNTTPAQTAATATGLAAGSYAVTVTDANGCTDTQTFTIAQPTALEATAGIQTNISCNGGANGWATVNVTGGIGAYTYSWNTIPAQTAATATGLAAGTYTVTVTDANGCTDTQTFTIIQLTALEATAGTQINVSCNGGANGSATVNVTGGTGTYTYNWNTIPLQASATATGLAAGTYTVTVTDANGCTDTQTFTIAQPTVLEATAGTQINVSCNGGVNGSATVNFTGGTGTYTYSWNTIPVQNSATATGLAAGTYTVTVTDANGCTDTQTFTITESTTLEATTGTQTNVSCNGGTNGSATVNVTGGTGTYTYSWNTIPAQISATATGLAAGTYAVTVTDANGCFVTSTVNINQPEPIIINIQPEDDIITAGGYAEFTVDASNVSSYKWQININGTGWTDIADGGTNPQYIGATTSLLSLTGVPSAFDGYQYRIILVNGDDCETVSGAAMLHVDNVLEAVTDDFAMVIINEGAGGVAGDVTANDLINGTPVADADITITITDNGGLAGATVDTAGNLTIAAIATQGTYTVTYSICEAANTANCSSAEVTVIVSPPLKVDGVEFADIIVYPNPASSEVFIKIPDIANHKNAKVMIYDANGKLVKQQNLSTASESVDVRPLKDAVYILEITSDVGRTIKRFVKKPY